jgi:hypothetical protein
MLHAFKVHTAGRLQGLRWDLSIYTPPDVAALERLRRLVVGRPPSLVPTLS